MPLDNPIRVFEFGIHHKRIKEQSKIGCDYLKMFVLGFFQPVDVGIKEWLFGSRPSQICMKATIKNKSWAAKLEHSSYKNSLFSL